LITNFIFGLTMEKGTPLRRMATLNVKAETKKAFRDLKWKLQRDFNKPDWTDDEVILFISTKLQKAENEERYGKYWFFQIRQR
jgi:hypothetical protein